MPPAVRTRISLLPDPGRSPHSGDSPSRASTVEVAGMTDTQPSHPSPRVIVIADVESNANQLVDRVLRPSGIEAWPARAEAPPAAVLVGDVTLFRGDPLSGRRSRRGKGADGPA